MNWFRRRHFEVCQNFLRDWLVVVDFGFVQLLCQVFQTFLSKSLLLSFHPRPFVSLQLFREFLRRHSEDRDVIVVGKIFGEHVLPLLVVPCLQDVELFDIGDGLKQVRTISASVKMVLDERFAKYCKRCFGRKNNLFSKPLDAVVDVIQVKRLRHGIVKHAEKSLLHLRKEFRRDSAEREPNDQLRSRFGVTVNSAAKFLFLNKSVFEQWDGRASQVGEQNINSGAFQCVVRVRTEKANQDFSNGFVVFGKFNRLYDTFLERRCSRRFDPWPFESGIHRRYVVENGIFKPVQDVDQFIMIHRTNEDQSQVLWLIHCLMEFTDAIRCQHAKCLHHATSFVAETITFRIQEPSGL